MTGFEQLLQLIAALQAVLAALAALVGPIQPAPTPQGCLLTFPPDAILGESYFLPEGQTDPRFPSLLGIGYIGTFEIGARQVFNAACSHPGIRLETAGPPTTPLQFTDVPPITAKPLPTPEQEARLFVRASDTKQIGVCRPGRPFETGTGSTCIATGRIFYLFAEVPIDPLNPSQPVVPGQEMTWTGFRGNVAVTDVFLDIFTPSTALAITL